MAGATRFRKKPIVIEAIQFTGHNQAEVLAFCRPNLSKRALEGAQIMKLPVIITNREGDLTASPGDWVIKGTAGEFYPCKPDIFANIYDPE